MQTHKKYIAGQRPTDSVTNIYKHVLRCAATDKNGVICIIIILVIRTLLFNFTCCLFVYLKILKKDTFRRNRGLKLAGRVYVG